MAKAAIAVLLAATFLPLQAWSLTCTSKDTEKLKVMYGAHLSSGTLPQPILENHERLGSTAVSVNGTVKGLVNSESCWKSSPPCSEPALYDSALINFITTDDEVLKVYSGNAGDALLECFRRLGLAAQPKKTGTLGRIFR